MEKKKKHFTYCKIEAFNRIRVITLGKEKLKQKNMYNKFSG